MVSTPTVRVRVHRRGDRPATIDNCPSTDHTDTAKSSLTARPKPRLFTLLRDVASQGPHIPPNAMSFLKPSGPPQGCGEFHWLDTDHCGEGRRGNGQVSQARPLSGQSVIPGQARPLACWQSVIPGQHATQ
ncbi:hypothetical protein ACOMHN_012826 [Nucella lapillus]